MSENTNQHRENPSQGGRARMERAEENLWRLVGSLVAARRFILGITAFVAVAVVVITLLMPNVYRATARVLLPESGGMMSSLLRNLPSSAAALLGGGRSGDYTRYMAILNSRSVLASAVDSFNLVQAYGLEDSDTPREDAVGVLEELVETEIDLELDFLAISVYDEDRQRAADLTNFLVRRLNEVNNRLASQNARAYRELIERRYFEAEAAMDSVFNATQAFQQNYGVYDLTAQTQSFFEQAGNLRAKALEAEVRYETLLAQYGPDNPSVQAARQAARSANAKYREALGGSEQLLPVEQQEVPELVRRYADLEMERTIQTAILEVLRPMYEQARLQEQDKMAAVQVLDDAVPPLKKAGPRRSIICIVATLSAFLLACVYVLALKWWRTHYAVYAGRLQRAVARAESQEKSQEKSEAPVSS